MSKTPHADGASAGRLHLAALAAVVLIGLALRVYRLGDECIWHDEYVSFQHLGAPSLGDFLRQTRAADPPMMPVYFTMEYCWARCGRDSVYALRWLSVLAGVGAIPLLYAFTRMHFGRWAAVMAALWLACSKQHILLSQEMRMYALVVLLALCSAYAFWRALHGGGKRWWALYAVANALLIGSHLLAVLVFVAQGVFLALRRESGRPAAQWALANLPAAAVLFLWMRTFDFSATADAAEWIQPPRLGKFLDILFVVYGGARFSYGDLLWHRPAAFPFHIVLGFLVAGLVGWMAVASLRRCQHGNGNCAPARSASCWFLFCWFFVPPIALVLISWVYRPCLVSRYAAYASLPLAALLSGAIASLPGKRMRIAAVTVLLALLGYHLAFFSRPIRLNWEAVATHLQEHAADRDVVIVPDAICIAPLRHYLPWPDERVQAGGSFLDRDLHEKQIARACQIVREGHNAWILSYDVREHRLGHLEATLAAQGLAVDRWDAPGYRTVSLYRIAQGREERAPLPTSKGNPR